MKAMVLAAGKAMRLRPVTDALAKPALSFFGRSILDRVLDGLADAGVTEAVVNLHHAPGTLRRLVAAREAALPLVAWSDETGELLGTGGALVPVRASFEREECFLLVNGDCVHDLDYAALMRRHRASGADCTLAVRPSGEPGFGALRVDAAGRVVAWSVPCEGHDDERHFLSAQAISPRLFRWLLPGGAFSSFTEWYPRAQAGGCTFAVHETDDEWHALDSRELYLRACAEWLERRGLAAWIDPRASIASDAVVEDGCVVHRGARVDAGARLRNSVLLEGAQAGRGAVVSGSLLGPGAVVPDGRACDERLVAGSGA